MPGTSIRSSIDAPQSSRANIISNPNVIKTVSISSVPACQRVFESWLTSASCPLRWILGPARNL